LNINQV